MLKTISLQELVRGCTVNVDVDKIPNGVATVDFLRQNEGRLKTLLTDRIVRRIDAGFARSMTVHPDTGHALYTVCRALRPDSIFETGTYWGYSTAYLAAGIRDNGSGKVHTFDIYTRAGKHVPKALQPYIEFHRGRPSIEMMPPILHQAPPKLFFQDSRHDYEGVAQELEIVVPYLQQDAIILFHDFVAPDVRQAATDILHNYNLYVLESNDPQQIGVAIRNDRIRNNPN